MQMVVASDNVTSQRRETPSRRLMLITGRKEPALGETTTAMASIRNEGMALPRQDMKNIQIFYLMSDNLLLEFAKLCHININMGENEEQIQHNLKLYHAGKLEMGG